MSQNIWRPDWTNCDLAYFFVVREATRMPEFAGHRVVHEYIQTNDAPPEKVFPLLCPVREAEWVPGWQYRLIYSQSGFAEDGCIFTTPNDDAPETTWVVTTYDPAGFGIAFSWVHPGVMTAQISIALREKSDGKTSARIRYTYTALSPEGSQKIASYDRNWFEQKMLGWEAAINHFLQTGQKIPLK
jgi:hypothetical protein